MKRNKTFLGDVNRDFNLKFDIVTEAYHSCGATLNGQFFIIGGYGATRQVNCYVILNRRLFGISCILCIPETI